MNENILISGTPIRIVAIILAIVIIIGLTVFLNGFLGFIVGVVVGGVNAVILYGFATIVDACHTYMNDNEESE